MGTASFVRLRNVSKSFGAVPALEAIDLEVQRGDFVSLIGPSGCGKSTLLRMIAGIAPPSAGAIQVEGQPPEAVRRDMFFVFQDATLLPWRRVASNVGLPLELRREAPERRRERVREMLDLVDLLPAADKYPWQLSGGMRMRASLARALSIAPRILLMDEPFGSLDEMSRDRLNEDLLALRERAPFTAFFVTHSVAEAVFLSNRIVVLSPSPGRIAARIEVPFPYPRRGELREDPQFLGLLAQTTAALRSVRPAPR
ncbi:MAG TPA: ABC transporter ATP-binding protein [Opitutaceae bacterium]|jgi:NitT/TauT family transport system ATP-binding protein